MASAFGGAVGQEGTDAAMIIICSFIVFTMQAGFGLLESGLVSRRSEANVMVKNMIDITIGGIAYWFVGYGFYNGKNTKPSKTMSGESYFLTDVEIDGAKDEAYIYVLYFFHSSFATACTTIVSGAVAERIKLDSYMVFAIINTALIYPFCARWAWHPDGWLYGKIYDYAGSAVLHMCGGAAAFAGTLILGPRHGRWTANPRYFQNASPTNVVLGTFFLWFGWIGFNCGANFAVTGNQWKSVGRIAVITMNGAMGGGTAIVILNLILKRWRKYLIDVTELVAGILGGLVAITAVANSTRPWEGLVIGFIGGLVTIAWMKFMDKIKVDDPVGCVAVHWAAGLWGVIASGFFTEQGKADQRNNGIFRGGNGEMLGWNLVCALVVTVWSFGVASIVFLGLKYTIGLRLSLEHELEGSDSVEHGILEFIAEDKTTGAMGKKLSLPQIRETVENGQDNKSMEMQATA